MKSSKIKVTGKMEKVIKARFLEGVFKPLESVELEEGKEVTVTIKEVPKEARGAFEGAMGGWRGMIDCEKLIRDIYKSRELSAKRFYEWIYGFGNK